MLEVRGANTSDPDTELVTTVKTGGRDAFRLLYQRHIGRVYAHCLRMTANVDLAADTSQEVFIHVWRNLDKFEQKSLFATWLHRITVNTCISTMRKRKNWLRIMQPESGEAAESGSYEDKVELHGLDKWIVKLPERARQVFILFSIEGYSHEEIAELLNTTTGTSKSQNHRARELLKQWLKTDYEHE